MITFTCKASGYTDMRTLRLLYEVDGISQPYRSGCGRSPDDVTQWEGSSTPDIVTFAGIEGEALTSEYCKSIARSEGFILTVKFVITDRTIGGKFYCRGFEQGVGELFSREIPVEVKSKHFQAIAVFL